MRPEPRGNGAADATGLPYGRTEITRQGFQLPARSRARIRNSYWTPRVSVIALLARVVEVHGCHAPPTARHWTWKKCSPAVRTWSRVSPPDQRTVTRLWW